MKHLLFVSPDTITDTLLAAGLLQILVDRHPGLRVTVACPENVRSLYQHAPFVGEIVTWRPDLPATDQAYRTALARQIAAVDADTCIHARTRRDPVTDLVALGSSAQEIIAHESKSPPPPTGERQFSRLVPRPDVMLLECQHHRNLLKVLGIDVELVMPQIWTSAKDRQTAAALLAQHQLDPGKTMVLITNPLHPLAAYGRFGEALIPICQEFGLRVLLLGDQPAAGSAGFGSLPLVDLRGRVSLMEAAEIQRLVRLTVGLEGPLAHVACAVGCRNVILLGGGQFGRYLPYSPLTSGMTLPINCVTCDWQCIHKSPYCATHIMPEVIESSVRVTLNGLGNLPRLFIQDMGFGTLQIDFPFFLNASSFAPMLYEVIVILPEEFDNPTRHPSLCGHLFSTMNADRRYSTSMKVVGKDATGYIISFKKPGSAP